MCSNRQHIALRLLRYSNLTCFCARVENSLYEFRVAIHFGPVLIQYITLPYDVCHEQCESCFYRKQWGANNDGQALQNVFIGPAQRPTTESKERSKKNSIDLRLKFTTAAMRRFSCGGELRYRYSSPAPAGTVSSSNLEPENRTWKEQASDLPTYGALLLSWAVLGDFWSFRAKKCLKTNSGISEGFLFR